MLNSAEHKILDAHNYKNIKKKSAFSDSDKPRMLFFLLINFKIPKIVGILTFMSRKIELSMNKFFITSGPGTHSLFRFVVWRLKFSFMSFVFLSSYKVSDRVGFLTKEFPRNFYLYFSYHISDYADSFFNTFNGNCRYCERASTVTCA